MAWYRAGSVSVTNGNAVVTGANTDFVSNTQVGEAFLGPDGRVYEVAQVVSATQIVLGMNYQGGTAGGQGYALMPTSSFARDLALGAAQLLNTFAGVRDGIGAGLIGDGGVATPALRFAADQDTGIFRKGPNAIGFAIGGVMKAYVEGEGLGAGSLLVDGSVSNLLRINRPYLNPAYDLARISMGVGGARHGSIECGSYVGNNTPGFMTFSTQDPDAVLRERMRIDPYGNLIVGVTDAPQHLIARNIGVTGNILGIGTPTITSVYFQSVDQGGWNVAASAMYLGRNNGTGRSLNAGGTVNASGADYAEYMVKASGCGTIAAGDVCGVDVDGHLTRTWADAKSFVVKSTDPAYVGGDTWSSHVGPRPEAPKPAPGLPGPAPSMPDSDDAQDLAAWREAVSMHDAMVAAYPAARDAWTAASAAFETALEAWNADLEAARVTVDRIAFCGQVPVNVTGDFAVGDYLIAAASGAGIKATAVAEADITFDQYRRRLGKVWAVRDGRAWIDVQHG